MKIMLRVLIGVCLVISGVFLCENFIKSNQAYKLEYRIVQESISDNFSIPEELKEVIKSNPKEKRKLETEFETTVHVSAVSKYPHLYGDSPLIHYVNKELEGGARESFNRFIEHESNTQEELDQDFEGSSLIYDLFPVCLLPNLVSVYGYESQTRSWPHGWTQYIGKNFWQNEKTIIEINLRDLFVKDSDWCNFLLQYCDQYFESIVNGYYQQDCIAPLEADDLDVFVLTEKGVMLVFRPYRITGWADGPGVLIIPYSDLKAYIDMNGPLRDVGYCDQNLVAS